MRRLRLLAGLCLACALLASACGESASEVGPTPASPEGAYVEPEDDDDASGSCDDFYAWRDAQDALDGDPGLEEALDEDYDGVACNDLGQSDYEDAWPGGYAEACEAVFFESPDGVLYLDDIGYEQYECEGTDSGAGDWEGDAYSEPETDGARDAWSAACDEFFNGYVGGDLFWGDSVSVSQTDCDLANAY